jgi:hypothetical protein
MLIAELLGTRQSALALMDTLDLLKYLAHCHQNQNVPPILNAQIILHAYVKNVRILASPLLVESMLNAGWPDIEQFAIVNKVMRVIPIAFVKNLDAKVMMSVLWVRLVSKENARIHVLMSNVVSKLFAQSMYTELDANVHLDTKVVLT